jgi:hypothetical protein
MINEISAPSAPGGSLGAAAWAGKMLLRLLSPGGKRGLSILIYHRVLREADPLFPGEVTSADFAMQLALLRSCFNVIPLLDAVRHAKAGTLPPRAACITFDDGYADNAEVALPLLQQYGLRHLLRGGGFPERRTDVERHRDRAGAALFWRA